MSEQEMPALSSEATLSHEAAAVYPSRRSLRKTPLKWQLNWLSVIVAVIAVAGMLVFMYPATAAWWSQYHESKVIDQYSNQVKKDPAPGNAVRIEEARQYNEMLTAGDIVVGVDSNKPVFAGEDGTDLDYWDILPSKTGMMARLKIPSINVDLPIYHGTSDEVLEHGVGHLQGTALPVGGVDTRSVLTAHTGLAKATLFNDLNKVQLGDTFTIEVFGEILTYRAIETLTILPDQTQAIIPREGEDLVTLITCTPLGINTHRYLVTGERITPTPEKDVEAALSTPDIPGFPWWAVIIPSGVALAGIYVWRSGYPPKPRAGREA